MQTVLFLSSLEDEWIFFVIGMFFLMAITDGNHSFSFNFFTTTHYIQNVNKMKESI